MRHPAVHVMLGLALLFGCGSNEPAPAPVIPSALSYAENPAIYTKARAIPNNVPSSSGGVVDSYLIVPTLPAGLTFDTATGILAGTPSALTAMTNYTVTAENGGGTTTVTLAITVNDEAPSELVYSQNPATYIRGQPIIANSPSNAGGLVTSYALGVALPDGLSFSVTTGVIAGTPSELAPATSYLVTATNSGGSTTTTLTIAVTDEPPSALSYSTNPAVYTLGQAIASNTPSSSGGAVAAYAIAPAPPAGLTFDTVTGVLAGTPNSLSPVVTYTVTATNPGGSTTATLTITVNDVAPSGLGYATNPAVYTRGQVIASNQPTSSGGPIVSYAISPALPAGLTFATTTGFITGTATVISPATDYTVTATNSGGSTMATVTITVRDIPPAALTYATNPAVYTKGQVISPNTPLASGGPVVSYAVTPTLPVGLALDTATGVISGTPTVVSAAASYVVTATNSGGSTPVTLTITVRDVAPSALAYSTNPAVYTKGQLIASNMPSSGGGPVISYAITPALPAGLALNTATGIVSGTPTVVSGTTAYTVTATNSGGSTPVTLTITVRDVPPSALAYSTNPAVYTKGQTIANNTPSSGGGSVISYAITPTVPAGLAFSITTGVLSGTPTTLSVATGYTVTATNSGGSTMATLTITVRDVAPSTLTYATNPAVYAKGKAIANNTPSSSGGPVVSYAIVPALPTGLAFNTATGVVSGLPTVISPATSYTVTATNSGGSTIATLTITVSPTWTQHFATDAGGSVAIAANDDVVVAGSFSGTLDLGGGPLTSAGSTDMFVARFDAAGTLLWARRYGDSAPQSGAKVTVDDADNLYLTGGFHGTIDFGGGSLTSAGDSDIFVAKLTTDGDEVWASRFGNTFYNSGTDITIDPSGDVLFTGDTLGVIDFGGGSLAAGGSMDAFVVKFTEAGAHVWSKRFGGSGDQYGGSVGTDSAGRIVMAGSFFSSINFGGATLTSVGDADVYLVQLDAAGNHRWSKRFGDANNQGGSAVVDVNGDIWLGGGFIGTIDLGAGVMSSAGGFDVFLGKFAGSGVLYSQRRFGDAASQNGGTLATDLAGNLVMVGSFMGTINFGGATLSSAVNFDVFLVKFSVSGSHVSSARFGDAANQLGGNVALDSAGFALITGHFGGTVNFGDGAVTAVGNNDMFFTKRAP